jgi:hypothetical protein
MLKSTFNSHDLVRNAKKNCPLILRNRSASDLTFQQHVLVVVQVETEKSQVSVSKVTSNHSD